MSDRAPRQEQLEATLRTWAKQMIEACRPDGLPPVELANVAENIRRNVLPVVLQLRAPCAHSSGAVKDQLPTAADGATGPPPVDLIDDEKNNQSTIPGYCGECNPVGHKNMGFNQRLKKPCPNCKLGHARRDAYAEAKAKKEREANG